MAMNLVRTGTAALVGLGSGVLNNSIVGPAFNLFGVDVGWDGVFEASALLVGVGGQAFMPHSVPNLFDGLTDSSLALVSRRLTVFGVNALSGKTPTNLYAQRAAPYRIGGAMYGGVHSPSAARGSNTTLSGLPRARAH